MKDTIAEANLKEYIISDLETLKAWVSRKSTNETGLRVPDILAKIDEIIKLYHE